MQPKKATKNTTKTQKNERYSDKKGADRNTKRDYRKIGLKLALKGSKNAD